MSPETMTIAETLQAQGLPITRPCVTWAILNTNYGEICGLRLNEESAKRAASDYYEKQNGQKIPSKAWERLTESGQQKDHAAFELGYTVSYALPPYYLMVIPFVVPPLT